MARNPHTTTESTTCDRCGADRPTDPRRLKLTFYDLTDATIQDENVRLCLSCWHDIREDARGVVA